jgi:hypothetical protein
MLKINSLEEVIAERIKFLEDHGYKVEKI